jgi:hypothetical protein
MKLFDAIRRTRYLALILPLLCVATVVGLGWTPMALKKEKNEQDFHTRSEIKRVLHAQIRDGLGKEVQFAGKKSTAREVRDSVESAASFIRERSGLEFSDKVKEKLAALESESLSGSGQAISPAALADVLADTAVERLSNVSDADIDLAAASLRQSDGEIILRGNGRGHTTSSEFVKQAKAMRNLSRQGDSLVHEAIRKEVEAAVTERVKTYSRALPEQFGEAEKHGVTPLQAVLITYSIVSDDLLAGSGKSLKHNVEKTHRTMKSLGLARDDAKPGKAYGKKGTLFAAPVDLVLDETTMTRLLDRVGEGGKK